MKTRFKVIARFVASISWSIFVTATLSFASCETKTTPRTSQTTTPSMSAAALPSGTIYQTDPIFRLLAGGYSGGQTTLGELKDLGDFGLGTFSDYQGGEMLMFGGKVYSIPNPEKSFVVEDLKIRIPFAMTTHFHPTQSLKVKHMENYASLRSLLDQYLDPQKNYAISIEGMFDSLNVQCVQPPGRPDLPFAEVAQDKAQLQDVFAQLVGFRMGEGAAKWNNVGYHFHARTRAGQGGHVLEFQKMGPATIRWQEASELRVLHP